MAATPSVSSNDEIKSYLTALTLFRHNLRSGSIFVSLCNNISAGKAKGKQSLIQTFYETSSAGHLPNQLTKITSVACFSSMQIFLVWEKCGLGDLKNSFYLLMFFQLKIKQSARSRLTFCDINGDLEGYFCWRRKVKSFRKDGDAMFY